MFYRDTWANINLDCFSHNIKVIKEHANKDVFCVLKADAYGHGDYAMACEAIACGCTYVVVSSLDEALSLRNKGFVHPILVLGYVDVDYVHIALAQKITLSVISSEWAKDVCACMDTNGLVVHIKVDTGMNRVGLKKLDELRETMSLLQAKGVVIEGLYTHFHSADKDDKSCCARQEKWFDQILDSVEFKFKWIHAANSDATISYDAKRCNAVRVGLALYGVKGIDSALDLRAVLSLYTKIICIKEVNKNETIGYGGTYRCAKNEWIATIPIGYGDGFVRTNQGRYVCVDEHPCEIVGRVCMDQCMIRLDKPYPVGHVVELIGPHIDVERMAYELGTIPYEVLCLLNLRIPRVFIKNGKTIQEEQ